MRRVNWLGLVGFGLLGALGCTNTPEPAIGEPSKGNNQTVEPKPEVLSVTGESSGGTRLQRFVSLAQ